MIIKLNDYLTTPATCNTGYWKIDTLITPLNPYATAMDPNEITYSYDGVSVGSLVNALTVDYEGKVINLTTGENEVWVDLTDYETGEYVFLRAAYYSNCGSNPCGSEEEIEINIQNTVTTDEFVTASTSNAYIGLDRLSGAANRRCNNSDEGTVGLIVNANNEFEIQYWKTVKGDGLFTAVQENDFGSQNISAQVAPVWTYKVCEDLEYANVLITYIYYNATVQTKDYLGNSIDLSLDLSDAEIIEGIKEGFYQGLQLAGGIDSSSAYNFKTGMSVYITKSGPTDNLMTIEVAQKPHYCAVGTNAWGIASDGTMTTAFENTVGTTPADYVSLIEVTPTDVVADLANVDSTGTYCGDTLTANIPNLNFIFDDGDLAIYSLSGQSHVEVVGGSPFPTARHWDYIGSVTDAFQITFDDDSVTRDTSCAAGAQVRFIHNRDPLNVQSFAIYKNNVLLNANATSPSAWYSYTGGDVFKTIVVTKNNPSCQLQKIFTL